MDKKEEFTLDNKTIAKLAIAIAEAIQLKESGDFPPGAAVQLVSVP
jgi:hypothetical protein